MVKHPGPDREFALWCREKKIRWFGVDCGSADHPMNTIIRDWMPRQAEEADRVFQNMYGQPLAERFTPDKYQLMVLPLEIRGWGILHRALRGIRGGGRVRGVDGAQGGSACHSFR